MFALNAPARAPKYAGVAFALAKVMTACFGRSVANCYAFTCLIFYMQALLKLQHASSPNHFSQPIALSPLKLH